MHTSGFILSLRKLKNNSQLHIIHISFNNFSKFISLSNKSKYALPYCPACGELSEMKLRTRCSGNFCKMALANNPPCEYPLRKTQNYCIPTKQK